MTEQLTLWGLPVVVDGDPHSLCARGQIVPVSTQLYIHAFQLHRPGLATPVWRSNAWSAPACVASDGSCDTPPDVEP